MSTSTSIKLELVRRYYISSGFCTVLHCKKGKEKENGGGIKSIRSEVEV